MGERSFEWEGVEQLSGDQVRADIAQEECGICSCKLMEMAGCHGRCGYRYQLS